MKLSVTFATLLFFAQSNGSAAQIIGGEDEEIEKTKPRAASPVDLNDPILRLNRFSFQKTVLQEHTGNQVKDWIVLFCPAWFEPCQALEPHYRSIAMHWQDQLNRALLSQEVRFAAVDCATEKALCNTQNVGMDYPMVWHYRDHVQVASWNGQSLQTDRTRLMQFLASEFAQKGEDSPQQIEDEKDFDQEDEASAVRKDLLLIFVAIAGNAWLISRSNDSSDEPRRSSPVSSDAAPAKPASSPAADTTADGECTARLLPKEWARDRPSIEL